jgi:hypothetical protein
MENIDKAILLKWLWKLLYKNNLKNISVVEILE